MPSRKHVKVKQKRILRNGERLWKKWPQSQGSILQPEYYPGMRAHMERMLSLLRLDLDGVRMIGIWGPPGIGKTTIARVLFHQISSNFQHSTIMVDVKGCFPRPCFDEYNVRLQLQTRMLSQITNHKELKIPHLGVASELLKDKKVLLVIDEVDHRGQLEALAEKISWFGSGSRIIVTTEDRSLLKGHDIDHIYKVKCPSRKKAFQIFCMHAFGEKHPPDDGFYKLAEKVSYLAGVLPLGLKVLGSALRGKSKQEWEMILPRLMTSLDGDIKSIIKFSYDALCDEDKYLFLYLSCFFRFELPLKVEEILASRFPNVKLGLHILTEKSLIFIDDDEGEIEMHDEVRKFGRETARNKFLSNGITKREILVDERDICEVLNEDTTDNNHLIAINLYLSQIEETLNVSDKTLRKMADLQFIQIFDYAISSCPCKSELQSLFFHSQKIRSLEWWYFGNICLPSTFNTEFLVNLNMESSKLEKLWEGDKVLKNLKWMDLSYSKHLKELPDLSTATNLEELNLNGCESLMELPDLSTATKLEKLFLDGCKSLMELPHLPTVTKLRILKLGNCYSLVKVPSSFGNFSNLEYIDLSHCWWLVELSFYIRSATNLRRLDLKGCSSLVKLPSSIGNLINLEEINLEDCSSLVEIPFSIGNLQKLEWLRIKGCSKVEALPTNINLKSLYFLDLSKCWQLKSFPEISTNIRYIKLEGCSSLVEIPISIGKLQKLNRLEMKGCSKLEALPTNINLESLVYLDLTNCSQLKSFPEISTRIEFLYLTGTAINEIPLTIVLWPRLWKLNLEDCNNLVSLPQFPDSLRYLDASNCKSLERLDCSFNNPEIELLFSNCFKLNQEARDLIINTACWRAVLPGTEVPACFNYCRGAAGGLLTIKLNESTHPTSLRFKVCFTLVKGDGDDMLKIEMMVKQNDHIIPCRSGIRYINNGLREHIYIFEAAFEVEAEEVTSTELLLEFKPRSEWIWKIGEWGLMKI